MRWNLESLPPWCRKRPAAGRLPSLGTPRLGVDTLEPRVLPSGDVLTWYRVVRAARTGFLPPTLLEGAVSDFQGGIAVGA